MKNKLSLVLIVLLCLSKPAFSSNLPHYEIKVLLDTQKKIIKAHQKVTVVNYSKETWTEIYFHVYPNRVFTKGEKKTLMFYAGFFKINPFPGGFELPKMNIFSVNSGQSALKFEFEGTDQTLLKVKLGESLLPGQEIEIDLDFSVSIPHAYGRFGWHDGVFALSHWYPILSVYSDKGWNKALFYPFHRPFYSDAANYVVELTVASNQTVVHSGHLVKEDTSTDGTKTLTIESKLPIREFSLATSSAYKVYEEKLDNILIKSFYLPGHEEKARQALEFALGIMQDYTQQFGAYPYEDFSIAPVYLGYGGEQMSNLAFIDSRVYDLPKFLDRYFDFLVAHETGHQWFYNLIGIDENLEMWLEEGVHSYFLGEYLEKKYGPNAEIITFPKWAQKSKMFLPEFTFRQSRDYRYKLLSRVGLDHPVAGELASFHEPSSIFAITYGKGSRIVGMLKNLMSEAAFNKSFERIFKEYTHQNLSIANLQKICEEESGKDLKFFFDQWLYTEKNFDVAIDSVKGNKVYLSNKGKIIMPVDVNVIDQNGQTEHLTKTVTGENEQISIDHLSKIKSITLDSENELLDIDRTNNHWPRKLKLKLVPLYHGLYDIPVFLPDDSYNLVVGPEIANGGVGLKASLQKPLDQIFYTSSDYEFSENILHSRVGYQLNNLFESQTAFGFEIANQTDYDNGDEDLVSGKLYLRKELWPVAYGLFSINDHVSLYLLRNRGLNQTLISGGAEENRNSSYMKRNESIIGTTLHLDRSAPYPDPNSGFKVDTLFESSQHFMNATQYFNRASIDTSFYQAVTLNSKLALRLKYGWGGPDDKNLYQLGGLEGLRGYDRKDLRGSNMILQSVEYRFPLMQNLNWKFLDNVFEIESIGGVVFFDAGQSWYGSIEDSDLKKDAGFGLRMTVNIGSFLEKMILRADAAKPINETETDTHFWFGAGHAF